MTRRLTFLLSVLSILAFSTSPAWAVARYVLTDLGNLGNGGNVIANSINKFGEVTGKAYAETLAIPGSGDPYPTTTDVYHAFYWDPVSGTMTDISGYTAGGFLPVPEFWNYEGMTILDSGTVVGTFQIDGISGNNSSKGFSWTAAGGVVDVAIPALGTYMIKAANHSGQIAGNYTVVHRNDGAYYYDGTSTTPVSLDNLGSFYGESFARDINENGFVVGWGIQCVEDPMHVPFVYDSSAGTISYLTSISNGYAEVDAINDKNWIAGSRMNSTQTEYVSFLYNGTTTVDLPRLCTIADLSETGQILGSCTDYGSEQACIWENGTLSVLGDLIDSTEQANWTRLVRAYEINDSGQIVGYGFHTDGTTHAWLLTPNRLGGDANSDGSVNGSDLNIVLSNYNQSGMAWCEGDFNLDRSVNGTDLNMILSNYNQSLTYSSTAAVPEPSTLLLMILGIVGLFWWRKRYST